MSSNNFITLSGVFTSSDVNNGIATTAMFSQSASNKGLITNQGTFAETTSNKGLATGVVVFQGTATNDGTVAEAVFLGSSRNAGTITTSATFANSSVNAGVVHGAAVLVDMASNAGIIAGSVQLGASASNTGTVYGALSSHTQGDGYYAYGYYAGGVRTAPPDYTTVVHQVGDIWYSYDANGASSLANGEYDDGTATTFVFVYGVKAAQTGGVVLNGPYSDGYYVDGIIDPFYTNATPQQAQDDGLWYTYTSGTPALVNGLFLDALLYYYYTSGVRALATGSYTIPEAGAVYLLDGEVTNLNPTNGNTDYSFIDGTYTPWNGKFYSLGTPYTGSAEYAFDEYGVGTMRMDFIDGIEVYNGPNV